MVKKQPAEKQHQLFQNFVNVAKLHYNQWMKEELRLKTGEKYERGELMMNRIMKLQKKIVRSKR